MHKNSNSFEKEVKEENKKKSKVLSALEMLARKNSPYLLNDPRITGIPFSLQILIIKSIPFTQLVDRQAQVV